MFSETLTKFLTIRNLKINSSMVYVKENIFNNIGVLCILKKVFKYLFNGNTFVNNDWNYYN